MSIPNGAFRPPGGPLRDLASKLEAVDAIHLFLSCTTIEKNEMGARGLMLFSTDLNIMALILQ